jgi:drug/metabolite transporter (DMT)-like permease
VADLALLLLTLFWGTTFSFVKEALAIASPGVFLTARFGLASLVLLAVWAARRRPLGEGFLRHGVLLGLAMLGGFVLQTVGLHHTTPARSGFITGLSVVIVPFIARFAMGRKVRASAWLGVALAVAGMLLLTRPFTAGAVSADVRFGDLLTFGCALAFALQIVFTSEWSPRHPLVPFVSTQVLVTFAGVLLLLVPFEERRFAAEHAGAFAGYVAFTGVAMTALAFFVMNWGQRHTTAIRAALIFALEPAAAAGFSWIWFGEPLGPLDLAGGALIVLGVLAGEVGGALEDRLRPVPPAIS